MLETGRRFPAGKSVATRAVGAYLAAMFIDVAAGAIARQSQIRAVQVFDLNTGAIGGRNISRLVALFAGDARMFSLERKSCFDMVERFAIRDPAHQSKIHAVMIGVAFRAFLACGIRSREGGVQAALAGKAIANFRVTLEAFKLRCAAFQVVALGAIRRPVQRLVRSCQRPGRNLGARRWNANYRQEAK